MKSYAVRYILGPQESLTASKEEVVQADSIHDALRSKSTWPIALNMRGTCGWAQHPGHSIYFIEAWEAEVIPCSVR